MTALPDFPRWAMDDRPGYGKIRAVSHTLIKQASNTAAHARGWLDGLIDDDSAGFEFGKAWHALVLEPERAGEVVVRPKFDRRTKDGKADSAAWEAENVGRMAVDEADAPALFASAENARKCRWIKPLIENMGINEATIEWVDQITGLDCKAKIDRVVTGLCLVDFKTARRCADHAIGSSIADHGYYSQAAWYAWGYRVAHGADLPFTFAFIEKTYPFLARVGTITPEAMAAGAHRCRVALERIAHGIKTGEWPGYPDRLETFEVPRYIAPPGMVQPDDWADTLTTGILSYGGDR